MLEIHLLASNPSPTVRNVFPTPGGPKRIKWCHRVISYYKVGEDGMSFTLDNGMKVVGNLIGGFTEDTTAEPVTAAAIYTNWNYENPIR